MSTPIFISYSSKDRAVAQTICEALENRGLSCWISSRDIGPGENFQVSIVHAIRAAKVMILVFSANSNNSDEIKKELVLAGQSHLAVIPVRVEDVAPEEAFAYELATRQWIDVFDDWENSIQRVVRQLETVGVTPPSVAPEAAAGQPSTVAPMPPAETAEPPGAPPAAPIAKPAQQTEESAARPPTTDQPREPGPPPAPTTLYLGAAIGGAVVVLAIVAAAWLWLGGPRRRDVPVAVVPTPARVPAPAVAPAPVPAPAAAPTPARTPAPALPPQVTVADAVEKGKAALDRKDYAAAMRWYRPAADQGDIFAQYEVGRLYGNGWGVVQDYAEALRWYRKAADQGNADAQNNIGFAYQNGHGVAQDYGEAMRWYRKAADQGNAVAQSNIGWLYQNGHGVAQDYGEAMRWYRKAADFGQRHRTEQYRVSLPERPWCRPGLCRGDALVPQGRRPGECVRAERHRVALPERLGRRAGLCRGDALVPQGCR